MGACTKEELDYHHPDVGLFVQQLKDGSIPSPAEELSFPAFSVEDIAYLLDYAEDMTEISSFPLAPVSYNAGGKFRLGECVLWTVESIRVGHHASLGCKLVHEDAQDYEGIYFLSEMELAEAVALYRAWWERASEKGEVGMSADPLSGSAYRWW